MKKYLLSFCLLLFAVFSKSQDYAYRQYTTKEGLAGNKVYQILKDKNNYLWFATETGVSRFDGTSFKNYTIDDGLPDNDIIKIFEDSKGRIWLMPFANKLCYFFNGKIYNNANDSVLKKIKINAFIYDMIEDKNHNIYFTEDRNNLIVLTTDNKILRFKNDSLYFFSKLGIIGENQVVVFSNAVNQMAGLYKISIQGNGIKIKLIDDKNRFYVDKINYCHLSEDLKIWNARNDTSRKSTAFIFCEKSSQTKKMKIPAGFNNFSEFSDGKFYMNTAFGSFRINRSNLTCLDTLCKGENISYTLRDPEGGLWLSTFGKGVYRILNELVLNVANNSISDPDFKFNCIGSSGKEVLCGGNNGAIFSLNYNNRKLKFKYLTDTKTKNQILRIKKIHGQIYLSKENYIYKLIDGKIMKACKSDFIPFSIKDMDVDSIGNIFIANNVALIKDKPMKGQYEYLFYGRSNTVSLCDSGIYTGNNNGVYFIDTNRKITFLGEKFPLFKEKSTFLKTIQNHLWAGTSSKGLLCFDGKNILKNINSRNGLIGNNVMSIFEDGNHLWVGTDKGINKIDISNKDIRVIKHYTNREGLSGNQIKDIYVSNSIIYVVTESGLSVIDENNPSNFSLCLMKGPEVLINGIKTTTEERGYFLEPNDNIKFNFVAISYKSDGSITYVYKIIGMDNKWYTTNANSIYFHTLPSGNYTFQIFAINRFGVKSELSSINFQVAKRFYGTYWFFGLMLCFVFSITWFLFTLFQKRKFKKILERNAIEEKIADLKQDALKAQMNPHFIFNALNSIQHFIIDKDLNRVNEFISSFASLIRAVLDNSTKKHITIAEELFFLENYLNLEKNRFDNSFDYEIFVQDNIDKDDTLIPPMLMQPFIENSIIHGIRHRKHDGGFIKIEITNKENVLKLTIIDNGVGRSVSSNYKTKFYNKSTSKGIKNVENRIDLLNKEKESLISLKIEDLHDVNGECGTIVTILLSESHNS